MFSTAAIFSYLSFSLALILLFHSSEISSQTSKEMVGSYSLRYLSQRLRPTPRYRRSTLQTLLSYIYQYRRAPFAVLVQPFCFRFRWHPHLLVLRVQIPQLCIISNFFQFFLRSSTICFLRLDTKMFKL